MIKVLDPVVVEGWRRADARREFLRGFVAGLRASIKTGAWWGTLIAAGYIAGQIIRVVE